MSFSFSIKLTEVKNYKKNRKIIPKLFITYLFKILRFGKLLDHYLCGNYPKSFYFYILLRNERQEHYYYS